MKTKNLFSSFMIVAAICTTPVMFTSCDDDDDTRPCYNVEFFGFDGKSLGDTQQVIEGASAVAPEVQEVIATDSCDWTFSGWDKDFGKVTSDLAVHALYDQGECKTVSITVKFDGPVKDDATVVFAWNEQVTSEAILAKLGDMEIEGFTFDGLDCQLDNATSNNAVYAKYTAWDFEFEKTEIGAIVKPSENAKTYFMLTLKTTGYENNVCTDGIVDNIKVVDAIKKYPAHIFTNNAELISTENMTTIAVYINTSEINDSFSTSNLIGKVYSHTW